MNILFGIYKADEGEIFMEGKQISVSSPHNALKYGIGMVQQHFTVVLYFSKFISSFYIIMRLISLILVLRIINSTSNLSFKIAWIIPILLFPIYSGLFYCLIGSNRFANFAKDFGFELKPCVAGRPSTKGKVETTMKLLDEIKAYNGLLNYQELHELVAKINDRVNASYHQGSGTIPAFAFKKEKDHLSELPDSKIRGHYKMINANHKVNKSSLFSFRSNMYSVPPEYIGKTVRVQVYANQLHVYYSTKLIAVHPLTNQKLNYQEADYLQITRKTFRFGDDRIREIAKDNLRKIGDQYKK
jgi:hypothetical protein